MKKSLFPAAAYPLVLACNSPIKNSGRPAGIAVVKDGALLVADDVSSKVWRAGVK